MSQSGFGMKPDSLSHPFGQDLSALQAEPIPFADLKAHFPDIVGESSVMLRVLESVIKIAKSQSSVLVLGESGTGKELIASAIHRLSQRADKRFFAINCSAIPENLLESELFGYQRGAFTGANTRRPGLFEIASGGTIFLDEVGDLPLNLQAKLLRVLQEKKFIPLGASEEKSADVRIIAATNVDLDEAVQNRRFRADLYYRLNVLPIGLPSLKERGSDILLLLRYFLKLSNRMHGLSTPCFLSEDAIAHLLRYPWPGNVRQLQNLVERLVVMRGGGAIDVEHIPNEFKDSLHEEGPSFEESLVLDPPKQIKNLTQAAEIYRRAVPDLGGLVVSPDNVDHLLVEGFNLNTYIENLENRLITKALEMTSHNRNRAAKLLGLNRTTLVERIKKRSIPGSRINQKA